MSFKYRLSPYLTTEMKRHIAISSIILVFAAIFFTPFAYSSDSEITKIEYQDNSRTTYFRNGTRHIEVWSSIDIRFDMETSQIITQTVIQTDPAWLVILRTLNLFFSTTDHVITTMIGIITLIGILVGIYEYWKRKQKSAEYDYIRYLDNMQE